MIVKNGIRLYHGSYTIVEKPDLARCRGEKDFGRGFYVTTDRTQAERFVRSSVKKAIHDHFIEAFSSDLFKGYVSAYSFENTEKDLSVLEFNQADADWLDCVVSHRIPGLTKNKTDKWMQYDVIAGKIANDNTNPTIIAYMSGLYGETGSDEAVSQAIRLLLPYRLKNQLCFRTDKALTHLKYTGFEEISWHTTR